MGKKGLWANMHAKRKRGESPAKPGDKDYPTDKALKDSAAKMKRSEYKTPEMLANESKKSKKVSKEKSMKQSGSAAKMLRGTPKKSVSKKNPKPSPVEDKIRETAKKGYDTKKIAKKVGNTLANAALQTVGLSLPGIKPTPFKMTPSPSALKCWKGYERVPGTKEFSPGSCKKK